MPMRAWARTPLYREVVGWTASDVEMGGYSDFCMNTPATARTVVGICHARGVNAGFPPQWLIYLNVADLESGLKAYVERGGTLLGNIRHMGTGDRYCVIQDPAGAVAALFEPAR